MIVHALIFYIFSLIAIVSAIMVTVSRNTVHSVFFLILDFISISCLFIMIGAEFLGMIMLIVYVGAVAVLFLFVVMMLNINYSQIKDGFQKYYPIGSLIGLILFIEIILMINGDNVLVSQKENLTNNVPNTHQIGAILYTDYIYIFQISGLILLVAMVGAITLTLRDRPGVKKQNIMDQNARKVSDVITIVKVKKNET